MHLIYVFHVPGAEPLPRPSLHRHCVEAVKIAPVSRLRELGTSYLGDELIGVAKVSSTAPARVEVAVKLLKEKPTHHEVDGKWGCCLSSCGTRCLCLVVGTLGLTKSRTSYLRKDSRLLWPWRLRSGDTKGP